MRNFTEKEQEFLKQIVDYKKSGNVEALRLYSLLACEFPGFIIKWNIEQNWENTILFIPGLDKDKIQRSFWELTDSCIFIKELCELGFVSLRRYNQLPNKDKCFFDYGAYVLKDGELYYRNDESKKVDKGENCHYSVELSDFLKTYHHSLVYPLPALTDFVNNNFSTLEDIRYHKQFRQTNRSIWVAGIGVIMTALLGFCELRKDSRTNVNDTSDSECLITYDFDCKNQDTCKTINEICTDSLTQRK